MNIVREFIKKIGRFFDDGSKRCSICHHFKKGNQFDEVKLNKEKGMEALFICKNCEEAIKTLRKK